MRRQRHFGSLPSIYPSLLYEYCPLDNYLGTGCAFMGTLHLSPCPIQLHQSLWYSVYPDFLATPCTGLRCSSLRYTHWLQSTKMITSCCIITLVTPQMRYCDKHRSTLSDSLPLSSLPWNHFAKDAHKGKWHFSHFLLLLCEHPLLFIASIPTWSSSLWSPITNMSISSALLMTTLPMHGLIYYRIRHLPFSQLSNSLQWCRLNITLHSKNGWVTLEENIKAKPL